MRLASNFAIERHVCAGLSGRPDELEGALEDGTGRKTTGGGEKKERVSLYVSRVAGRHLRVYTYYARELYCITLFSFRK